MPAETLSSPSEGDTVAAGRALAGRLQPGDVLLLTGDLAAGKTTLVRGIVDGAGGDAEEVSSPSFVLVQSYPCRLRGVLRLHHVDLYRLADRRPELRELGLEDLLSDPAAVVAIEWPRDAVASWVPHDARVWRIALTVEDDDSRSIVIHPPPPR